MLWWNENIVFQTCLGKWKKKRLGTWLDMPSVKFRFQFYVAMTFCLLELCETFPCVYLNRLPCCFQNSTFLLNISESIQHGFLSEFYNIDTNTKSWQYIILILIQIYVFVGFQMQFKKNEICFQVHVTNSCENFKYSVHSVCCILPTWVSMMKKYYGFTMDSVAITWTWLLCNFNVMMWMCQ